MYSLEPQAGLGKPTRRLHSTRISLNIRIGTGMVRWRTTTEQPFSMFVDLQNRYDWVLQPVVGYPSVDRLLEVLEDKVVRPAEAKVNELLARRTNQLRVENV
jgi:hypothetical protein